MYTVLIMQKKTADNMQEHYPALKNVLEQKNIGICQWIKNGDTVETALPELYDLIGNHRHWRAVVVMYDEENLGLLDAVNPFDYSRPETVSNEVEDEQPVDINLQNCGDFPLIRLTHFLSGVPAPEREYELEAYSSEDDIPFSRYIIKNGQEGEQKYKELCEEFNDWNTEYMVNGVAPEEVVLVKTRDIAYESDFKKVRNAWKNHNEADSSEFWRRNMYPRNNRFLLYDIEKRGMMYEERDAFKFWVALLTLAVNSVSSDILQPHKLYKLDADIDSQRLTTLFQNKIKGLNQADYALVRSLTRQNKYEDIEDEIPDYKLGVPVTFQTEKSASSKSVGFAVTLCGGITTDEMVLWDRCALWTYTRKKELLKNVSRQLEKSSLGFRDDCEYTEPEVSILDKYTEEDLREKIHDTYEDVLKSQNELPRGIIKYDEEMREADGIVRHDIYERMSFEQAATVIGAGTVCALLSILPAFSQSSSQMETVIMLGAAAAVLIGSGLLSLFLQKRRFGKHVRDFSKYFMLMNNELNKNAGLYTKFLSNVASHIHGASYLKILEEKKADVERKDAVKKSHLEYIEDFKNRVLLWGTAFGLNLDKDALDEQMMGQMSGSIDFYNLYSFSLDRSYNSIPLNNSGNMVYSPFGFVSELQIDREEIYDDVR